MASQTKRKFRLTLAKWKPNTDYRDLPSVIYTGPGSEDKFDLVRKCIGDSIDYGRLFAYLFRRFGYPNTGWDDYKQLVKYDLSTPLPDLVLRVVPSVGNNSSISILFLIAYDAFDAIQAYQQRERTAYAGRMLDWIEASGRIPEWMPECIVDTNAEFQLRATSWREVFNHLALHQYADEDDPAGASKRGWAQWREDVSKAYEAIEASPGPHYRSANWQDWPDEDPLKRYVAAAEAALEDLKRPVRVRDRAINAFGQAEYSAKILKEPAVAGYPSGHLGNLAPKEFAELHSLVLRLGKGNAKRGIAKVMAAAQPVA